MLKIALAGLVLNKVITLEQAERIDEKLKNKVCPDTVTEIVKTIREVINESL